MAPLAVVAPTTRIAADAAPQHQDFKQYQGRAGRDRLWEDINVDEYPDGDICLPVASML